MLNLTAAEITYLPLKAAGEATEKAIEVLTQEQREQILRLNWKDVQACRTLQL